MKIFIDSQNSELTPLEVRSIVIEFDDEKTLELVEEPETSPPTIPCGLCVWGGRAPSPAITDMKPLRVNITTVAANGVIVAPCYELTEKSAGIKIFINDAKYQLKPVKDKRVVIELSNGKFLELLEEYSKKGLLIWGGRQNIPGSSLEEMKERSECLGFYPLAGNHVHVFPYRPC